MDLDLFQPSDSMFWEDMLTFHRLHLMQLTQNILSIKILLHSFLTPAAFLGQ